MINEMTQMVEIKLNKSNCVFGVISSFFANIFLSSNNALLAELMASVVFKENEPLFITT